MTLNSASLSEIIRTGDFKALADKIIDKFPVILAATVIIVIGFIISNLIGKFVVKGLEAKGVDPSIHSFIRTIVTFTLKLIIIISALSTLGVDVNSIVTAIGAAGITAGLGLQQSVSQFASGIQILINHPFKSGDFVDIGSVSGKVHEIKMMYTVLITIDNKRVIIPNSTITAANIINYNGENRRRLDLEFCVSYDTDIELAKATIAKVVKSNPLVFTDPEPIIAVKAHAASSINLACLIWCDSDEYWNIYYFMQEQVKLAFDENNISIPYGQLDVHITKE